MKLTLLGTVQRLLWSRHPRQHAFVRRFQFSWSAEVVMPGQIAPPYRTVVVAEAGTLEELQEMLQPRTDNP